MDRQPPHTPRAVAPLRPGDRVLVVGAGPAGLTAAYLLQQAGARVTVFEGSSMLGGISQTAQYKGYRFDIGGHRFFTKYEPVEKLWHEILGPEFISVPRQSRIHYRGKYFDYPLKAWNALSGLGLFEAIRCVYSYGYAKLRPSPVEENLEQWVSNRFGKRLYEIFFTLWRMRTSPPIARSFSVHISHICPGPRRGYWNSSIRLLILVERFWIDAALRIALASERFWMRCAAHSARTSVHGMPQTFSV